VASSTPAVAAAPSSSSQSLNTGKHKALATPAVRRIAKEHKIDIAVVSMALLVQGLRGVLL
jgi:pyruvate/2-oxoglutarate dehydrogenase complex dihydrolipoamide acyltransferase (E2) component